MKIGGFDNLRLGITPNEYLNILIAADLYELFSLKLICEPFIAHQQLVIETVADVYDFAEIYGSQLLMHLLSSFWSIINRFVP